MKFGVGQPIRRKEDDRFLRGAGRYVDDIKLDGQLYAHILRSPHAHAILGAVDVDAARAAPGVHAVFTHADTVAYGLKPMANRAPMANADGSDIAPVKMPHLASGRVRYVGQPIAMIIADSPGAARDAADLIMVEFEDLPAVSAARDAIEPDAPALHDDAPGNLSYRWTAGDADATEAAFAAAAHRVSLSARCQRLIVNAMEPRAANAVYDAETDRWTIHVATQGVHAMRGNVAFHLGVEPDRLRILTPDVGGGFGMKLMVHPEYALVAMAAHKLGRPVKWTADRSESFLADAQARDLDTVAEGAFDADGTLLAMRFMSLSNLGAYYSQFGAGIHAAFSAQLVGGIYRTPAAFTEVRGVFTNTTPTDAYRGAGRPEMAYLTERVMEKAARTIGLDPAEIRRRNLLTPADMPFANPTGGAVFDSGDCVGTLEAALAAADYSGAPTRKAEAEKAGRLYGVACSYYMERTGGGPVENARLRVRADGRIEAWIGTQSNGQGHETAWAQLIHEKLGVDLDRVDLIQGDSDLLPAGGGTGGSRSLIMAHRTFFLAAEDVIEKGKQAAAEKLEAAIADIEFSPAEGGLFRVAGTDKTLDLWSAAGEAEDAFGEPALLGEGGVTDREATFPNGAHVVEVEIDPDTGWPHLKRYTVVDDFGTILNPLLVEGQVHGGVAQGVGQALFEGAAWDPETGQPLTGSLMDYALPRASDFPPFSTDLSEAAPSTTNPLGVKGCGEAGTVGATPAVTLAILDALRPLGVEEIDTPLTPLKIWRAIQDARS
ncbi:MAG: xanthine dehydrogenase family protein molybdopterin-binding subunit [Pseudomonadota bacterium]